MLRLDYAYQASAWWRIRDRYKPDITKAEKVFDEWSALRLECECLENGIKEYEH